MHIARNSRIFKHATLLQINLLVWYDVMTKTLLLKEHIRPTQIRIDMLRLFLDSVCALSIADIRNQLGDYCDRVTIYRTLNTFLDHSIIHKILMGTDGVKYAMNRALRGDDGNMTNNHVHFRCEICDKVYCLDVSGNNPVILPDGFEFHSSVMIVNGKCENCSTNSSN